jgi:hypothetical protein
MVTWLLKQIDQDERQARELAEDLGSKPKHWLAWWPARVLAECAAKRQIIERYQLALNQTNSNAPALQEIWIQVAGALEMCVQDLVVPYSDRPGCEVQWLPHP